MKDAEEHMLFKINFVFTPSIGKNSNTFPVQFEMIAMVSIQPKNSHPSLQATLQIHSPKHMTSSLALALGLPSLVGDSGHACTGSRVGR